MASPDLDQLVADAQRAVDQQRPKPLNDYREPHAPIAWSWWYTAALWLLMVVMAWLHFADIRGAMFGLSRAANDEQVRAVLGASRDAVLAWRRQHGSLPTLVPVPALDAIVQLTPSGDTFVLGVTLNGQSAEINEAGQITIKSP